MDTNMEPLLTTPAPHDDQQQKIIVLAVFVVVFGLSTLGLIIYILFTKCRHRFQENDNKAGNIDSKDELVTVVTNTPPGANGDVSQDATGSGEPHDQSNNASSDRDGEDEHADQITPLRKWEPQPTFSFKYRRDTLDVFSTKRDIDEDEIVPARASAIGILMAIQNCYQDRGSPAREALRSIYDAGRTVDRSIESLVEQNMIPAIEEVKAVNVQTLGNMPASIKPSPVKPPENRPKSFFNVIDDGKHGEGARAEPKPTADVSHGMFVSKQLGKDGGVLQMYGVTLEVPAGALTDVQNVCLGILWSADHQPKLANHEAILSPIVSCEPHGLVLKKDAFLTLPHCAHNVKTDWKLKAICSETSTSVLPVWKNENVNFMLDGKSKVKVTLKHFTLYTDIGEAASPSTPPQKWVDLIAFAPPLNQGTLFQIYIYCVNDYDEEDAKDTKGMVKRTGKTKSIERDQRKILFYGDKNDLELEVSISKETKVWEMSDMSGNKQKMDYELVWQAAGPSCKFVLTSSGQKSNKVVCAVDGYQLGHTERKQTLCIAEEEQIISQTKTSKIDLQLIDCVFPEALREIVIKYLDPKYDAASNWVQLAECMDKSIQDVYWLTDLYQETGRSPTIYLLQDWVKRDRNLEQFDEIVVKMGRHDLHEEIQNWIASTAK